MTEIYECKKCGVVTRVREELCDPVETAGKQDFCGIAPERDELCDSMKERLSFVCGKCGRPAEQADLVCKPLVTG